MFDTKSCIKCLNTDTDTLHISLSCMIYAFNAVNIVMELTLNNRLKIRLHLLAGNLNNICDAVFAAKFHLIHFRTNDCDLMIFHFAHLSCLDKLCAVYTGTIKLNLHIFTSDDLTFKCRGKCNRNIDLCDLDLDISGFQGHFIEISNVCAADQSAWNFFHILILICNDRESKLDSACPCCKDHIIHRFECIYKCRYTILGICKKAGRIARCHITEDQCRTKCN